MIEVLDQSDLDATEVTHGRGDGDGYGGGYGDGDGGGYGDKLIFQRSFRKCA